MKSISAKPIATANEKTSAQRPSLGGLLPLEPLLLRVDDGGVVRRDRQRAEADRERLAERDDAADDRQAKRPVARGQGIDLARDLGDLAVRLAHRDRPVARSAHHDALEDGLAADCLSHRLGLRAGGGAAGLLESPLEALDAAARVDELLLPRIERVALRADLDAQLGLTSIE